MDYFPALLKEVFTFNEGRESILDCRDITLNRADFTAGGGGRVWVGFLLRLYKVQSSLLS